MTDINVKIEGEPHPLLQDYRYYDVFSAVFKITDACNLNCSYCYRENASKIHTSQNITLETIDKTLDSILKYKQWLYNLHGWKKQPSLYFIWHGGEPLLVGIPKTMEILDLQRKYQDKGLEISNCVQTNGTLLNEKYLEIYQKERFRIGISIDGPSEVHDTHRLYRDKSSSFEETYRAIQLLKKHQYPWSAISVITEESLGKEEAIYNFFKTELPWEVDFTPAFFYETSISLSPENYANFMIKMFDIWIAEMRPSFEIRFFKDVLYILGYGNPEKDSIICELAGKCHRNISIASNGDIYSCECLNSKLSNKIGNILSQSFLEIVTSEPFIRQSQKTNSYRNECLICDVFFVCKAGCFNRRLPRDDGQPRLDYYCEARKKIIHHIIDYMQASRTIIPSSI